MPCLSAFVVNYGISNTIVLEIPYYHQAISVFVVNYGISNTTVLET